MLQPTGLQRVGRGLETERQSAGQGPAATLVRCAERFAQPSLSRHYSSFTEKHTEARQSTSTAQMVLFWIPHHHKPHAAFQEILTMPTGSVF